MRYSARKYVVTTEGRFEGDEDGRYSSNRLEMSKKLFLSWLVLALATRNGLAGDSLHDCRAVQMSQYVVCWCWEGDNAGINPSINLNRNVQRSSFLLSCSVCRTRSDIMRWVVPGSLERLVFEFFQSFQFPPSYKGHGSYTRWGTINLDGMQQQN